MEMRTCPKVGMVEEPDLLRYEENYSQKQLEGSILNWAMKEEIAGRATEEVERRKIQKGPKEHMGTKGTKS